MQARVDEQLCTGCGLCPDLCPDVFELVDDKARVTVDVVPVEAEASCREAMEGCPVAAIAIEE